MDDEEVSCYYHTALAGIVVMIVGSVDVAMVLWLIQNW